MLHQQQQDILQHHQKQAFTPFDEGKLATQAMDATARAQGSAYAPQADHRAKRWADTTAEEFEEVEHTGTAEHMEQYYAGVTADATMAEHDQTSSPDKAAGGQALSMSQMLAELDDHRRQNA